MASWMTAGLQGKSVGRGGVNEGIAYCLLLMHSTGSSEGTISMQEGEVLSVVEEDKGDGWTRVRRSNGDEGYIPTSYVNITLNK